MAGSDAPLSIEDRLSLWIGRVAQAHVDLEWALQHLWRMLVGSSPAIFLAPDTVRVFVQQCLVLIDHFAPELPEPIKTAAIAALQRAREHNDERNRVIHGRWLLNDDGETMDLRKWVKYTVFSNSETKTIEDLEVVRDGLRRSRVEVQSLSAIVAMTTVGRDFRELLPEAVTLLEGNFTLDADGEVWVATDGTAAETDSPERPWNPIVDEDGQAVDYESLEDQLDADSPTGAATSGDAVSKPADDVG